MAAPVAAIIQLPDDSGNVGKKIRTRSRTVGANTVHEHIYVQVRDGAILAVNAAILPLQTVQASAQNITATGFLWFSVPTAVTGKKARIRRMILEHQPSTVTTMNSTPRIALARYTFTGTASGASVAGAKLDSAFPSSIADLRTAVTGMTVSAGALLATTMPIVANSIGTVGTFMVVPTVDDFLWYGENEDEFIVVAPGEGICLHQPDAGTASDTRKFSVTVVWDEIDTA